MFFSLSRDCETYQGHSWSNRFEWNRKTRKNECISSATIYAICGAVSSWGFIGIECVYFMFLIEKNHNKAFHFNPTLKRNETIAYNIYYTIFNVNTHSWEWKWKIMRASPRIMCMKCLVKHLLRTYKWNRPIYDVIRITRDIFLLNKNSIESKSILLFTCISLALSIIVCVCMSNFAHRIVVVINSTHCAEKLFKWMNECYKL